MDKKIKKEDKSEESSSSSSDFLDVWDYVKHEEIKCLLDRYLNIKEYWTKVKKKES